MHGKTGFSGVNSDGSAHTGDLFSKYYFFLDLTGISGNFRTICQ